MSDTDRIRDALDALETGQTVDQSTARLIASQWHGGQASALYAFSSSGYVDRSSIVAELARCAVFADIGDDVETDRRALDALRAFVLASDDDSPIGVAERLAASDVAEVARRVESALSITPAGSATIVVSGDHIAPSYRALDGGEAVERLDDPDASEAYVCDLDAGVDALSTDGACVYWEEGNLWVERARADGTFASAEEAA